ncbi:hypothetical protein GDO81_013464 [Engystomops pustulosus]|uniref:Uncharacterized protein n=1 Tax=Engystomops pustulosus TaxID=76066 RepID=A0AAV7B2V2_ENGPU|nr:hypothetical protein GDO81_013464 [Engystomops pustulosus]
MCGWICRDDSDYFSWVKNLHLEQKARNNPKKTVRALNQTQDIKRFMHGWTEEVAIFLLLTPTLTTLAVSMYVHKVVFFT